MRMNVIVYRFVYRYMWFCILSSVGSYIVMRGFVYLCLWFCILLQYCLRSLLLYFISHYYVIYHIYSVILPLPLLLRESLFPKPLKLNNIANNKENAPKKFLI